MIRGYGTLGGVGGRRGRGHKSLMSLGTFITLPSVPGVTGVGYISNEALGADQRLWATCENLSGTPLVVGAAITGQNAGAMSTYPVTGAGNTNNFGGACSDGTYIYICDASNKTIYKVNPGTGAIVANSGALAVGTPGLAGIVYHPVTGKLYFADNTGNGQIGEINTDLATGIAYHAPTSLGGAHGLNLGPDGDGNTVLWFCEALNTVTKVAYMTTAGVFTEFAVPGNYAPYYTAQGDDGNVYFTMRTAGRYGQIQLPVGTITTWVSASGAAAQPGGMWADGKGHMLYNEEASNKIVRFPVATPGSPLAFPLPVAAAKPDKVMQSGVGGLVALTLHDTGELALFCTG